MQVEQVHRTLATEWAYRRVYRSNDDRTAAIPAWLAKYSKQRTHDAIGGPPISRRSPP